MKLVERTKKRAAVLRALCSLWDWEKSMFVSFRLDRLDIWLVDGLSSARGAAHHISKTIVDGKLACLDSLVRLVLGG